MGCGWGNTWTEFLGLIYEVNSHHVASYEKRTPKHSNNTQKRFQSNNSCVKSTKPITQREKYSNHYHSHFVKSSENTNKPTRAFCNHCCKTGHISLECFLRNSKTNTNYVWMRKDRNMASTSTSIRVVPKMT